MIKVYQTRYGGEKAPLEKRGNCVQAGIASILEMKRDDVLDISQDESDDWYESLQDWPQARGFNLVCFPYLATGGSPLRLPGYYMVGGKHIATGIEHVQVALNGELIHCPLSPDRIAPMEPDTCWLIYKIV